jgi:hypothetical protein
MRLGVLPPRRVKLALVAVRNQACGVTVLLRLYLSQAL